MTKLILVLIAISGLSIAGLPSQAHDLVIPPWRGSAASTFQEWRFDAKANPASPEVVTNPYGLPSAAITVGPFGSGWLGQIPGLGTQYGYWDMGSAGIINLTIPDAAAVPSGCSLMVAVQATYFRDITQAPTVAVTAGTRLRGETDGVETVSTGGAWWLDQSYWRVPTSPAIQTVTLASDSHWGAVMDQVVVDTLCVQSPVTVGKAKLLPNESLVELTGPVVTRVFESYFYIEDAQRIAGIRVNCSPSQLPSEGTMPTVLGTIRSVNGERVIDQSTVFTGASAPIPGLLAMNNTATLRGLLPQGLRTRLWGRAHVSQGTFTIQDGSAQPVRVELHGVAAPADGSYAVVTGVLGSDLSGPILRVNARDSVQSYP